MVVKDTLRTVLKRHPTLLTAAFLASTYSLQLLADLGSNATNNGP